MKQVKIKKDPVSLDSKSIYTKEASQPLLALCHNVLSSPKYCNNKGN
jgi:hypothetical protein